MTAVRVLLANQPRLLRKMLRRAIENTSDVTIIGEAGELTRLLPLIEEAAPHWIILSLEPDGHVPDLVDVILARWPSLQILAMATDGSQARVEWTVSSARGGASGANLRCELGLGDLSLNDLIMVLRSGALSEELLLGR